MNTIHDFLGDGDGPATKGQVEDTRGPILILPKPKTCNWRVGREGELVVIRIGNATLRMPYKDAMPFGHAIMAKSQEAKVQAGEMGKRLEMRG